MSNHNNFNFYEIIEFSSSYRCNSGEAVWNGTKISPPDTQL